MAINDKVIRDDRTQQEHYLQFFVNQATHAVVGNSITTLSNPDPKVFKQLNLKSEVGTFRFAFNASNSLSTPTSTTDDGTASFPLFETEFVVIGAPTSCRTVGNTSGARLVYWWS